MKASSSVISQANLRPVNSSGGLFARIRRALGLQAPTREEIRRRMLSKPGLVDSLSPDVLEYLRNYDGPEHLGPLPVNG